MILDLLLFAGWTFLCLLVGYLIGYWRNLL